MLIADCRPNRIARPAAAKRANGSSLRMARDSARMHDEGEQRQQREAEDDAEFLGADREDEVGMAVRQDALDRALARAAAEPAAAQKDSIAVSIWKVSPDAGSRKRLMRPATCGTIR